MQNIPIRWILLHRGACSCASLFTLLAMTGCSNSGTDATAVANKQTLSLETQIKNVENDTKTPPQIKQGIIASLRAQAQKHSGENSVSTK